jgi:hypothetical protein
LRCSFKDVPLSTAAYHEAQEHDDPEELLVRAIDAMGQGQTALATGYMNRLNAIFGCPPFTESEIQKAMILAGFDRMVFVETGEYEAAE